LFLNAYHTESQLLSPATCCFNSRVHFQTLMLTSQRTTLVFSKTMLAVCQCLARKCWNYETNSECAEYLANLLL